MESTKGEDTSHRQVTLLQISINTNPFWILFFKIETTESSTQTWSHPKKGFLYVCNKAGTELAQCLRMGSYLSAKEFNSKTCIYLIKASDRSYRYFLSVKSNILSSLRLPTSLLYCSCLKYSKSIIINQCLVRKIVNHHQKSMLVFAWSNQATIHLLRKQ